MSSEGLSYTLKTLFLWENKLYDEVKVYVDIQFLSFRTFWLFKYSSVFWFVVMLSVICLVM